MEKEVINEAKELLSLHSRLSAIIEKEYSLIGKNNSITKSLNDLLSKANEKLIYRNSIEDKILQKQAEIQKAAERVNYFSKNASKNSTSLATWINKSSKSMSELSILQKELNTKQAESAAAVTLLNKMGMSPLLSMTRELSELWEVHPMFGISGAILSIFTKIVSIFKDMDKSAFDFRIQMGIIRKFTSDVDNIARNLAIKFSNVGVSASNIYKSFVSVAKTIGTADGATKDMVSDMSIFSAQLGISEQTSADFLKTMAMVGHTTLNAQRNMLFFLQRMSQAANVPLNDVMMDVNNFSRSSYQFLRMTSLELVKAAVEARLMGTSLDSSGKSASSLIQFTSNVRDEMEASVLLGQNLNLQKARELAYQGDILNLNKEILKKAEEINFEQLDPFQREAVAKAFGKTSYEMGQMLQASREQRHIEDEINKNPALRKRREELEKMRKATSAIANDYAEQARIQLQTEANQERIKSITQSWNKIWMQLSEKFLPVIDKTLKFVADNMNDIFLISSMIVGPFRKMGIVISLISSGMEILAGKFKMFNEIGLYIAVATDKIKLFFNSVSLGASKLSPIYKIISKIFGGIGKFFGDFGELFGGAGKFLGPFGSIIGSFGKWIPFIGWIITGLSFIINLFKRLDGITKVFKEEGIWRGIVAGISAIIGAVYDTLIQPFVDVWNWLKETFFGSSPSKLGLSVVEGIRAVESMLIDVLLSPFQMAWDLIKKIPFIGRLFNGIDVSKDITPISIPVVSIGRPEEKSTSFIQPTSNVSQTEIKSTDITDLLSAIKAEIQNLRKDFASGALASTVYLDSQKISSGMERTLRFKGELSTAV